MLFPSDKSKVCYQMAILPFIPKNCMANKCVNKRYNNLLLKKYNKFVIIKKEIAY